MRTIRGGQNVISWSLTFAALCMCYLMYEFRQETALQLKECRDLRFPRDKRRGCLATSPGSKLPMVRSVLLRTFLNQKVLETFGQHDPIPSSVWKETAGVGPCMENKSHGVAGGGRCGWKTLKRQFVVVSNCTYFFLKIWRARARSKVLPRLELSIVRENVFGRKRKNLKLRQTTAKR